MFLLIAGCTMQNPDDAKKADDPSSSGCSPALAVSSSRDSGIVPLPVSFSGAADCAEGAPVWDFGDGTVATGWEVDHLYMGSGEFTATLQVGDVTTSLVVHASPPVCPELQPLEKVGELGSDELDEASGLSHTPDDVLWTHNDSGDGPRLFAMAHDGSDLGTYTLEDAPDGDWEDSARAIDPDTGEVMLYIGDIGDNEETRDTIIVFLVPEPAVSVGEHTVDTWAQIELQYPDGAKNADTLMVDPVTGDLYIVAQGGSLYRKAAPHEASSVTVMEWVADLPFDMPVGGDISPLGDRIAVRSGDEALMWLRDRSLPFEDAFSGSACALTLADEVRGESLAFAADGDSYFTVSEELAQPIWEVGFVEVEQPCATLEARIERTPDGQLPLHVDLAVDEACVPAGVAEIQWTLGEHELSGQHAQQVLLASGSYPLTVTLTDANGDVATATDTVVVRQQSCPDIAEEELLGTVTDSQIVEASGLIHTANGVLWTHNDSGGVGELYALSEGGELVDRIDTDISGGDWEDLAYGWTEAGGWTLFVGDIGDNAEKRESIKVFLVPEDNPDDYGVMELTYADGPHNCESITLDPANGDLVVITKDYDGETSIWTKPAPHLDGEELELTWIADLDTDALPGSAATTAAHFSPDGSLLAVRTYSHVWLYRRDRAEPLAAAFEREACDGHAPSEKQGEALSFAADGSGYFLLSEGEDQPLYFVGVD